MYEVERLRYLIENPSSASDIEIRRMAKSILSTLSALDEMKKIEKEHEKIDLSDDENEMFKAWARAVRISLSADHIRIRSAIWSAKEIREEENEDSQAK